MQVGFIIALTFISLCIAIFCIAPNIYWIVLHYKLNKFETAASSKKILRKGSEVISMHFDESD